MKNVLFLHSSSELYGSDRSLLNLLKNLKNKNFKCIVILPEEGPLAIEINKLGYVKVIIRELAVLRRKNLSLKGLYHYSKQFLQSIIFLKKVIKLEDIDIVYTNTSVVFPGGIAAKLCGKKSIWHVREIIDNNFENKVVSGIVNIFSDVIIANSKATAKRISNNDNKVRIVYNAIESKETYSKKFLKRENDQIVIGMAGRINRWKGQKLFVDMAEIVFKEEKNVKFVIAGDVYKDEIYILNDLREYIDSKNLNNKIELLGQVNDMEYFYKGLDIFVLPSIQPEPFGLVVIEAMDKGIPVIATNHGGPIEIIDDGKNGYLVDYRDANEMSQKVIELVRDSDLRNRIGREGREKRNKVFNIENYANNIIDILNNA